ncbi:MAG: hypothetical protein WCH34_13365 [Bacteroidota bacterium]
MKINYVYNEKGIAEYVVVPTTIWELFQEYMINNNVKIENPPKKNVKKFNPREYKGILNSFNLDIEKELMNMKKSWKRNI